MLAAYLSWLVVVCPFQLAQTFSAPAQAKPVASENTSRRLIHFPDTAVGIFSYESAGGKFRQIARGDISVPGDAVKRTLRLTFDAAEKPVFLNRLSEDDVQTLILSNTAVKDDDCRYLPRLKGLNRIELALTDVGDAGVKQLQDLPALAELDVGMTQITDESLTSIAKIRSLRYLRINRTKVTDVGLARLKGSHIRSLWMQYGDITNRVFATLVSLPSLEYLDLDGTQVTDEGLTDLPKLKNLSFLGLANLSKVTDKSIPVLSTMSRLTLLYAWHNGISPGGIELLKKNLPHCKVRDKKQPR